MYCLGATCEELATNVVKTHYNKTDVSLGFYQFGNKYRDELRTRGGLARAKEFIMKDAYAFNATARGAREGYEAVRDAYLHIFSRLILDAVTSGQRYRTNRRTKLGRISRPQRPPRRPNRWPQIARMRTHL